MSEDFPLWTDSIDDDGIPSNSLWMNKHLNAHCDSDELKYTPNDQQEFIEIPNLFEDAMDFLISNSRRLSAFTTITIDSCDGLYEEKEGRVNWKREGF